MPQFVMFTMYFRFPIPNRDVERQLTHTPVIVHATPPILFRFEVHNVSSYLEALLIK